MKNKRVKLSLEKFEMFVDGYFNLDAPPDRYNYLLGYNEGESVAGVVEPDLKSQNRSRTTFDD